MLECVHGQATRIFCDSWNAGLSIVIGLPFSYYWILRSPVNQVAPRVSAVEVIFISFKKDFRFRDSISDPDDVPFIITKQSSYYWVFETTNLKIFWKMFVNFGCVQSPLEARYERLKKIPHKKPITVVPAMKIKYR